MTDLEDRLRRDLPELADGLGGAAEPSGPRAAHRPTTNNRSRSRFMLAGAAATLVGLLIVGLVVVGGSDADEASESRPTASVPVDFGDWVAMPDAPIAARPFAATAWTGTEAVFWAGSSLSRGFAFSDGAAYDPRTETWRTLRVPGWGHPGLSSIYFDDELYALAKGGGTRYDPTEGTWVDLPQVDDMLLAAAVATDDAVWGLGPSAVNPAGQPDLSIARYESDTDSWDYRPVFEGTDDTVEIITGLSRQETQVVWSGNEIIAWNGQHGGITFDPAADGWGTINPPVTPSGVASDGDLIVVDGGLAVIARIDVVDDRPVFDVAMQVAGADDWQWIGSRVPVDSPDTLSSAVADEWIVLFSASHSPITIHTPTGAWHEHDAAPLGGMTAPNAAWTGEELVIWGGVHANQNDLDNPPTGAAWTPPTD